MGLITSQRKELKHLTTRAQLSTLENGAGEHWAETMRRDLLEAKRYLKPDYIKTHLGRNENSSDHCTVHS